MGRKFWKKAGGWALSAAILLAYGSPAAQQVRALPEVVYVQRGTQRAALFDLQDGVTLAADSVAALGSTAQTLADVTENQVTITPLEAGETSVTVALWGKIPIKTVTVSVFEPRSLIVGGQALGMTLLTQGVLVVGLSGVQDEMQTLPSPAQSAGVQSGDMILRVDDTPVDSVDALKEALEDCGETADLCVRRGGQEMTFSASPVRTEDGVYLGIWARDSTAGIGTMTYYDPQNGTFGALGHPISDPDTGALLQVRDGEVFASDVIGVRKGQRGSPGQLEGAFGDGDALGVLTENTLCGVFGTLDAPPEDGMLLPIAPKGEVQCGKAKIFTTVDGQRVQQYDCRIERIYMAQDAGTKSMVIEITDPELLAITGGIVQGMSGSPIIQDGKMVGAVTHVCVFG